MSTFEQYLASQRYCGELDSTDAQFTLSLDKALEKLRHHSLAEGEWILKIVQTATAAQTTALKIKQDRLFTFIEFIDPTDAPTQMALRAELEVLGSSGTPVAKELALGLLAVSKARSFKALWSSGETLEWDKKQLVSGHRNSSDVPLRLYVEHEQSKKTSWPRRPAGLVTEFSQLRRRAIYAPVEIWVDGRPLKFEPNPKTSTSQHGKGSPRNLMVGSFCQQTDGDIVVPPQAKVRKNKYLRDAIRRPQPFLQWEFDDTTQARSRFHFFVSYRTQTKEIGGRPELLPKQEAFHIHFTRLGVLARTDEVTRSYVGGFISVEAEQATTDFAGLAASGSHEGLGPVFDQLVEALSKDSKRQIQEHQSKFQFSDSAWNVDKFFWGCLIPIPVPMLGGMANAGVILGPLFVSTVFGRGDIPGAKDFLVEQLDLGFQEISEALHKPPKPRELRRRRYVAGGLGSSP